jgi:hypothetical protein
MWKPITENAKEYISEMLDQSDQTDQSDQLSDKTKKFHSYLLNAIIKNNYLVADVLLNNKCKIQNTENDDIKKLEALLEKVKLLPTVLDFNLDINEQYCYLTPKN